VSCTGQACGDSQAANTRTDNNNPFHCVAPEADVMLSTLPQRL
jgi:hypothetical protein